LLVAERLVTGFDGVAMVRESTQKCSGHFGVTTSLVLIDPTGQHLAIDIQAPGGF